MTEDKGILIRNIYYMLVYAYHSLSADAYNEVQAEQFEHIYDLFASILSRGISYQLKQGLYKEYAIQEENLSTIRGKVNINQTILNQVRKTRKIDCEYDELSVDNIFNQILKSTAKLLILCPEVRENDRKLLKEELLFFDDVKDINTDTIQWKQLRFQKSNANYQLLITVCYFILDGLLCTTEDGKYSFRNFLDDQKMNSLYERFVLNYYKYHFPQLHPRSTQIKWNICGEHVSFLPLMVTDITLEYEGNSLIIDTKYYGKIFSSNYEKETLRSGHLYQIFSYVKNYDVGQTGTASGLLLYAKTNEDVIPHESFTQEGNHFYIDCLDLNRDFKEIKEQLNHYSHWYLSS